MRKINPSKWSTGLKPVNNARKALVAGAMATILLGSAAVPSLHLFPLPTATAATNEKKDNDTAQQQKMAKDKLNEFYKPALEGRFPGYVSDFQVGKTTKKEVYDKLDKPAKVEGGFEFYTATMGQPGYALSYRSDVLQEIRYFGTNVERQTNIGGMTIHMLWQQWYAPKSSVYIGKGKTRQIKVTYLRGDYKLEFIFNTPTDLDHINLVKA